MAITAAAINGNREAQLWLFDFDNTLAALEQEVDWAGSRHHLEAFLRSTGIDEAIFTEFPTRNLPLYNALLTRLAGSPDSKGLIRQASAIIESYELRAVREATPLPGAIELLVALHSNHRGIAIVTSNSSRTVGRWLLQNELAGKVGAVVGRDSLLPLKPSPEMVRKALELSGRAPPEAVLVGDSEADLNAAAQANVGFFGVSAKPEARTRLEILGASEVFASPAALALHFGLKRSFVKTC
jgi:HAD superfamily hydrolase (TIGR01509 family)